MRIARERKCVCVSLCMRTRLCVLLTKTTKEKKKPERETESAHTIIIFFFNINFFFWFLNIFLRSPCAGVTFAQPLAGKFDSNSTWGEQNINSQYQQLRWHHQSFPYVETIPDPWDHSLLNVYNRYYNYYIYYV